MQCNAFSLKRASQRDAIARKWQASIGMGDRRSHVRQTARPQYVPARLIWSNTLQNLVVSGLAGGAFSAAFAMRRFLDIDDIATLLMIFSGLWLLYSLPKLGKAGWLQLRNGSIERSLAQLSETVLHCLCRGGDFPRHESHYDIRISRSISGKVQLALDHANRGEELIFLESMSELLGPLENPRYLLLRHSWLPFAKRTDYHAVPERLGKSKTKAQYFAKIWRRNIGPSKLIYCRQKNARKILLRARSQSFAAGHQRAVERRSIWM